MSYKFNPFTGTLDEVGAGGAAAAAGSDTQIQYNDGGSLGASADLTWDDSAKELGVGGDINLDDGGTYATTLQMVTPTADRTISFPDATGTVALVAGSSGQLTYNSSGAQAGLSTLTTDGTDVTLTGRFISSLNGAASEPPGTFTGTWFTGGTSTTTKPQVLIEPTGTTSTAWSTNGTGFGVNAPSGFGGNLLDLQVDGTSKFKVHSNGYASGFNIGWQSSGLFHFSELAGGVYYPQLSLSSTGLKLTQYGRIGWTGSGASSGGEDLALYRDASNILAQRNVTNAQTFRVYNTFTNASNYERGFLQWNSGVFEIGTEGAGTGSEQPVRITAATLNIPNLPEYADDSAAGTGGLVAGDVYKTATGELRIKL